LSRFWSFALGDASSRATLFDAGKAPRFSHRPGCFFWLARGTIIATGFASRLALPTAGSWVSQCRGSTVMPSISSSLRIAKDFSLSRSRSPLMPRSRTIFANRSRLTRMLKPSCVRAATRGHASSKALARIVSRLVIEDAQLSRWVRGVTSPQLLRSVRSVVGTDSRPRLPKNSVHKRTREFCCGFFSSSDKSRK